MKRPNYGLAASGAALRGALPGALTDAAGGGVVGVVGPAAVLLVVFAFLTVAVHVRVAVSLLSNKVAAGITRLAPVKSSSV